MEHMSVPHFLGVLVVMLGAAKLGGALAKAVGQPSVLGELVAGVFLGASVLGLVDPKVEAIHLLAELGVVILLFAIGLETDLTKLLKVGGASAAVAVAGVVLPFAMGYGVCRVMGLPNLAAIMAGATLTATSVGITARVLSDLGRLQEPESQVVLGAAVIDDIVGLIILSIVVGLTQGQAVSASVSVPGQRGASPLQVDALRPVTDGNCVAARRGGKQPEVNDQSATQVNSIRPARAASPLAKGEAQTGANRMPPTLRGSVSKRWGGRGGGRRRNGPKARHMKQRDLPGPDGPRVAGQESEEP